MNDKITMIPIERIHILNPRHRDPKKFQLIVQSIKNLGLKKPIQVRPRASHEGGEQDYDLVYGQGRIEAFVALGYKEIPAIIVEATKEECLLRSLVENMARRFPSRLALINEIERLKAQGYNNTEIARKLDIDHTLVGGLITLKKAGEERLLDAAIAGRIPLGVAMDIAKTDGADTQRALLKAYEEKKLNYLSIRLVKRLMDQRRFIGKQRGSKTPQKRLTSTESLVNAYRRESQRQKLVIKKAKVCEEKLLFIVTALDKLLADENFVNLLRAESLGEMPRYLHDKLDANHKEAA